MSDERAGVCVCFVRFCFIRHTIFAMIAVAGAHRFRHSNASPHNIYLTLI